jgi:hypothetical protein
MQPATGLTTRVTAAVAAIAAVALGLGFAGCNTDPEQTTHVSEGQGMQLGDLLYNVQITRILNPSDAEDKAYLVGQKPPGPDQYYLGVFMRIQNEGDTSAQVPTGFKVVDTIGDTFNPIPSKSLFALKLGDTMHSGDELPEPESTAANGPIEGSMVLFRVTESAVQDRPLPLQIPSSAGSTGTVELDI